MNVIIAPQDFGILLTWTPKVDDLVRTLDHEEIKAIASASTFLSLKWYLDNNKIYTGRVFRIFMVFQDELDQNRLEKEDFLFDCRMKHIRTRHTDWVVPFEPSKRGCSKLLRKIL